MAVKLFSSYFEAGNLSEWGDSSQATWTTDQNGVNHNTTAPYSTTYGGAGSCVVQSTVKRSGSNAARIILRRGDVLFPNSNPNGEIRALINGLPGGGTGGNLTGVEMWMAISTRIDATTPANQLSWFVLAELHQSGLPIGGGAGYFGPAPFNLDGSNDQWKLIVRGASNPISTGFQQTVFNLTSPSSSSSQGWTPPFNISQRILSPVAYTEDVWDDWVFGWKLSGSSSVGWFEAWHRLSTDSSYTQVVQRSSIATWYDNYAGFFMADIYRRGYPAISDANVATVYIDAVEIWNGAPDQLSAQSAPVNTVAPAAPSGNDYVGAVLTASTGTWSGDPTSYAYQWVRCDSAGGNGADISAATSSTYTLVSADLAATIRCRVTASNAAGAGVPATSAQTGVITAAPATTAVTVDAAAAAAGSYLTTITVPITISASSRLALAYVTDNYLQDTLLSVLLGGQAMTLLGKADHGSNSETALYSLADPPTGATSLVVTSSTQRIGNAGVISLLNTNTTTAVGTVATATGVAAGSPSLDVTSAADDLCVAVICHSSAVSTDPTITNGGSQTGRTATVATNLGGGFAKSRAVLATRLAVGASTTLAWTTTPTADAETVVVGVAVKAGIVPTPVNTVSPVVTGEIVQGETLTCSQGTWQNSPTSYGYQWQRDTAGDLNFANISAATASTRVLDGDDVGCNLRCVVTATNASGATAVTTTHRGIVAPASPVAQTRPTITGTATVGETLTCDTGSWLNLPTSYSYQWQRDSAQSPPYANIASATSSTYVLVAADNLCNVVCVVTATNATGSAAQTSASRLIGFTASRHTTVARSNTGGVGRTIGGTKAGTGGGL